ncbi:hypothetical protein DFAR_3060009 [Desulfarculales bacterium]
MEPSNNQLCTPEEGCLLRKYGIPMPVPTPIVFTKKFWWIIGSISASFLLTIGVTAFFMFYPFKTVVFTQPIKVTNPRPSPAAQPQVAKDGVVDMTIYYEKFTDAPSLIVCTLVRKFPDGSMVVLDSNTRTAHRKRGKGITYAHYHLNGSAGLPGKDTYVVFSIFYTLYGVRPIMAPQFETEPFEIVKGAPQCP